MTENSPAYRAADKLANKGLHYLPNANGRNAVRRRLRQAANAELKAHMRDMRNRPAPEADIIVSRVTDAE